MEKYGEVLASEKFFEQKDPNWAQNQASWWYKEVGRAGEDPPLWMRSQVRGQRTHTYSVSILNQKLMYIIIPL